jgi:hemerythrin-like domain-containing protein
MCEYCGCRGVPPIAELMDEHSALVDQAQGVRQALSSGDPATAMSRLQHLVAHLNRHVQREEAGIFRAMRGAGEFVDEVDQLEAEHRDFAATIVGLDSTAAEFGRTVTRLLDDLDQHVEREDLGIFPVSVVTLGATGWAMVDEAHIDSPSFLLDQDRTSIQKA